MDISERNLMIGLKQSLKAVKQGKAQTVLIASDAEQHIIREFQELCLSKGIEIKEYESMKELGKTAGIDVGAAVVCICK